jgi:hypothetical protein
MSVTTPTWEGAFNLRDLGGLPTPHGPTRSGALLRSGHLGWLTPDGRRQLIASGVRTIVDLRVPRERQEDPTPELPGVVVRERPLVSPEAYEEAGRLPDLPSLYRWLVRHRAASVVAAVTAVAEAPPGSVLVHCAAGKDRSAVVIASILALAGVVRADIVEDYLRSEEGMRPYWARIEPDQARRSQQAWRSMASLEAISAGLDELDLGGGAEAHLRAHGLSRAAQAALLARLVG